MLFNETEVYFRQPGAAGRLRCRVCGALCAVNRGAVGPTCWAEALARHQRPHDRFTCPRAAEPWHARARRLRLAIDHEPSLWLSALLGLELRLLRLRLPSREPRP